MTTLKAQENVKTFRYQGIHRRTGKPREGTVEALSESRAIEQLEDRNISVTLIREHRDVILFERKPNLNQLGLFYKEIATLLSAETAIPDAIRSAQRSTSNTKLKRAGLSMERDMREGGMDLADAMRGHRDLFDEVTIALMDTARQTGKDIEVLGTLAESYFWTAKIAGDVRKSINKPLFILGFTLIVMYALTTNVVPQFVTLINNMDVEVPQITKIVMAMSRFMSSSLFLVVVLTIVVGVPLAYRAWIRTEQGTAMRDATVLRLPLIGRLMKNYILTRTGKSLADMISSGVPKEKAMYLTGKIAGNTLYEAIFLEAARSVEQGNPMADVLEDYPALIPTDYAQIVRNGEEKQKLDTMLVTLSGIYEKRVDETVQKMTDSIEPILTVVIGGLVALILFAVMMPIMTIIQNLQG